MLFKNVRPYFENIVRSYTQKIAIECNMMEIAKSQSVFHQGFSLRFEIGNDMGGVEKFLMS